MSMDWFWYFQRKQNLNICRLQGRRGVLSLCRHISAEDLRSAEKNGMAQM